MDIQKLEKFITGKLKKELPKELSYHNVDHTLEVLKVCREYIHRLKLDEKEAILLETAAIMHDTGYIWFVNNHEEHSIDYTRELLPDYGYSPEDIETICNIILATKIPQRPTTLLEQIIGDADLDYLGTKSFYEIGRRLYYEFLALKVIANEEEWNHLQIRFIQQHNYHTEFAQIHREPVKQKHLIELIDKNF